MSEEFSPVAKGIVAGLEEVLNDVKKPESALRKTVVYTINPKDVRKKLHMTQSLFSKY